MSKRLLIAIAIGITPGILFATMMIMGKSDSGTQPITSPQIEPITSFDQLALRYKDIRPLAWQQSFNAKSGAYRSNMKLESIVSQNSLDCSIEVEKIIRDVEKVYSSALLPKKVYVLIGDSTLDRKWFENQTRKYLTEKYISYDNGKMINPETVNAEGIGVTWASDACNDNLGVSTEDGIKVGHGFFHVIQTMQFTSNKNHWGRWGDIPRWLLEGGATFTQNFWKDQDSQIGYLKSPMHIYDLYNLDENFYRDYFKYRVPKNAGTNEVWEYTNQWPNDRAYDAGSYMCEILVAMKGPESILNLYKEYLATDSFDVAFKNIYGISWSEAYPYLWKAVKDSVYVSMKQVMPWVAEPTPSSTLFDFSQT